MINYNPVFNLVDYFHSKAPWFHSWNSPKIRIKIKIISISERVKILVTNKIAGIGIIKVISTSKIKKITAIK